jgi:phage replication O-like protein O
MENPWKRLSKINPQREDGTRQINNDVLDALIKAKLPTIEMGIVLTIISKTWGFKKHSDAISIGQFSDATGYDNRNIKRAKNSLVDKRIICATQSKLFIHGNFVTEYLFNKHFDTWLTGGQIATSKGTNNCNNKINKLTGGNIATGGQIATGGKSGKRLVVNSPPTKETITKEKDIYTSNFISFWTAYPKKVGKGAAFKAYQNIKTPRPSLSIILKSIESQNKTEQWQNKQFIPHPSTWINERRWEDELDQESDIPLSKDELLKKYGLTA